MQDVADNGGYPTTQKERGRPEERVIVNVTSHLVLANVPIIKMKDVLRTTKCLKRYKERRKILGNKIKDVNLLNLPLIKEYEFWTLVRNEFPYDKILIKHDLLVPKRRFPNVGDMEDMEFHELLDLKEYILNKKYDAFVENTKSKRTVTDHFHIHCIKFKYLTPISEL